MDLLIAVVAFVAGYAARTFHAYLRRLRSPLASFEIPVDTMDGKETP